MRAVVKQTDFLDFLSAFYCPSCTGNLMLDHDRCVCEECGCTYPISSNVPVLIDDLTGPFTRQMFVDGQSTFFRPQAKWRAALLKLVPNIAPTKVADDVIERLISELLVRPRDKRKVLVIGGGVIGAGMARLLNHPDIDVLETDAAWAPRTQLICDAAALPFKDRAFDSVISQAVLEHVIDPFACVAEMHRVLRDETSIAYVEVPLMQPVHGGAYDFHRFTHSGLVALMRNFKEISSGAASGPFCALAFSASYAICSPVKNRGLLKVVSALSRILVAPLKFLDPLVYRTPAALDGACALYFVGYRSDERISDADLIAGYRGAQT